MNRTAKVLLIVAVGLCALAVLAASYAPFVYAEFMPWLDRTPRLESAAPPLAKGRMVDDYFAVQDLGDGTYAIGEPRYWQQNYAYLIVGEQRALLFDAGSGTRDMSKVVAGLTPLPVTVMVSHLHFDHLGGISAFGKVAMLDSPETRARTHGQRLSPSRYEYAGFIEGRSAPEVAVSEWLKPGASIDLGGKTIDVLSTPGHTPTSIALWDAAHHRLFIGDFIYPTTLYAFLPGASLSAYRATTRRLLGLLPPNTVLWTAHCCRHDEGIQAPWLGMPDLKALDDALAGIEAHSLASQGFYPRVYPVNAQMTLAAGFPWNNR